MTWSLIHRFHSDDAEVAASEIVARDPESLADDRSPIDETTRAQIEKVVAAVTSLVRDSPIGEGGWEVRAGGHANPGGKPVDGQPHEMVTLTISWLGDRVPVDEPAPTPTAVDMPVGPVGPVTADGSELDESAPLTVDQPGPAVVGPQTADGSTVDPGTVTAPAPAPDVPVAPTTADGSEVAAPPAPPEPPEDGPVGPVTADGSTLDTPAPAGKPESAPAPAELAVVPDVAGQDLAGS